MKAEIMELVNLLEGVIPVLEGGEPLPDDAILVEAAGETIYRVGYEHEVEIPHDLETVEDMIEWIENNTEFSYDPDEESWRSPRGEVWEPGEWDFSDDGLSLVLGGERVEAMEISASEFLDQYALDIEVRCTLDGRFLGADVTVATGGPSIVVKVNPNVVVGYWGGEEFRRSYDDKIGLYDAVEELWNANRK